MPKKHNGRLVPALLALALALVLAAIALAAVLAVRGGGQGPALKQHLELGQKYLEELDYESAVLEFTGAIEIDDRSVPAYLGRGEAYLGLEEYESAEADFTMVIVTLEEESPRAYAGRARANAGLGNTQQAEADLQRAEDLGLPADQAEEIRQQVEAPALPLTADQLTWVVEPSYDYQRVVPLRGCSFSSGEGPFSDGKRVVLDSFYEMSFPGYSNLPQYYQVQLADGSWRLYFMPDHVDSGTVIMDSTSQYRRLGGSGISTSSALWGDSIAVQNYFTEPWEVLGNGTVELYWGVYPGYVGIDISYDTATRQGVLWNTNFCIQPVADAGLHKPYPAGQVDTSGTGIYTGETIQYGSSELTEEQQEQYRTAMNSSNRAAPVGYIGTDGQPITDFIYDYAEDFSEGIAACCKNGKWGYIDETGAEITEFLYDGIWPGRMKAPALIGGAEDLGAYPCTSDTMVVYRDGQAGLLYRDGRVLIDFGQFEDLAPAYNNELWAKQGGLWGLIDLADAKQKAGLSPELTAPAKTEVPDHLEQIEAMPGANDIVQPDYPRTVAELNTFNRERNNTGNIANNCIISEVNVYTGPGTEYQVKAVLANPTPVYPEGTLQNVPGWVCVRWFQSDQYAWAYGWVADGSFGPLS